MPEHFVKQGTPEWLALRKGRITASIAAACLGMDPHKSRQWAWREVLGTNKEYKENKHQAWGHEKEEPAARDYEVITGNLIEPSGFWTHPAYDWLGASPDRKAGRRRLVEVKAPQKLPTETPIAHRIQILVQLYCCQDAGIEACDYFAWHSMQNYFMEEITLATAWENFGIEQIIAGLKDFRERYVLTNTEPERKTRAKKEKADPAIIQPEELEQTYRNLETYPPE